MQTLTLDIKKTILHAEMVIDNGCHGAAIFGSTGQAQLIPVSEKINLLNHELMTTSSCVFCCQYYHGNFHLTV